MVFVFEFVYIVDYVDGFPYIKRSVHPWDEVYLVMMDDPFDVFLDSVSEYFPQGGASMSLKDPTEPIKVF